uniref:Uncharacterized protein n=1 Tax=Parascaris equorum TaxID=6256 RepID=A0A914RR26_PAREQ
MTLRIFNHLLSIDTDQSRLTFDVVLCVCIYASFSCFLWESSEEGKEDRKGRWSYHCLFLNLAVRDLFQSDLQLA